MHPTTLVDTKMLCDALGINRFAYRRKAGQLAFMPVVAKAESSCGSRIGLTETIDRRRRRQALVSAIDRLDCAIGKMTVAVIHRVAAAIGGHKQGIIPFGVEERRQCVCEMVVIEMDDSIVAQPAIALHRCHDKEILYVYAIRAHRHPRNPS